MNPEIQLSPILVADDNPTDVFFLQRGLTAAGIRNPVQHVEDGIEAIELLENYRNATSAQAVRPWLLFLDLKMPRMDGFDVLKWVHEHGLTDWMTIVVLTTSDEPKDIERARVFGAHRFLVKYPQPAELNEAYAFAVGRVATPTTMATE
jgi:two-component system response regulator